MTNFSKTLLIAALALIFLFAGMVGGPANGFDRAIMLQMAEWRVAWPMLVRVAGGLTDLGSVYGTLGVTAAASLYLALRRMPWRALLLAVTVLAERALVDGLKAWLGRGRPDFDVSWLPPSFAFPSGHSANSMTAFLATALIAASPAHRRTAAIAAIGLAVLIGLTRIILGVHWPSDVIGGWALGLLAAGTALMIGERSGLLPKEPKHQIVGGHRPTIDEDQAA